MNFDSEKKRRLLLAAAIVLIAAGCVYEFFLSGKIGEYPVSACADAVLSRLPVAIAAAIIAALLGYKILRRPSAKSMLAVAPCFVAVVLNPPILGLAFGDASISYGAWYHYAMFALECALTGLSEELIFRGILFPALLERMKDGKYKAFAATVASSAIFAAIHVVNLLSSSPSAVAMQVGYSFLIGGLCAFAMLKTGNVLVCAAIHAIFNFTGTLVERLGNGGWGGLPTLAVVLPVALCVAAYVVFSLLKTPIPADDGQE